jgi:transcriptional regulator with XRE-family HTH domain
VYFIVTLASVKVKVNPEAVRALRMKDGWSLAAFARAVGVTPSHLSNIEAGRRGCSPGSLKRMAEVLVVPVSALLWHETADTSA